MRPSIDEFFMLQAFYVADRATCDRKKVGAIITVDNHIVSTGYNGAPAGLPHCDDVGHELSVVDGNETCVRTTHAEMNAIFIAAKYGRAVRGGTIYVTHAPCKNCAKGIITAGLRHVVFQIEGRNTGLSTCIAAGLTFQNIPPY